ncbi:MAG TPA: hypothetical protein VK656_01165 [Candidatus Acidoferrum sp.]|nr:hypothetical protein [Candidatus Acidoferrum sp.]
MPRVIVRILHPSPAPDAGPLERLLAEARQLNGERHVAGFRATGAEDVSMTGSPPDDTPFADRLRTLIGEAAKAKAGLVVLGSGSVPAATMPDRQAFVDAARGKSPKGATTAGHAALTNNRYSGDIVAIATPADLAPIPDPPADNALPRWLDEVAGWAVTDLRAQWRLQLDLDSPLDVELIRPGKLPVAEATTLRARLAAVATVMADPRAELMVAGRTSAGTLRWLETDTACRVRALVEERGLRASSRLAQGGEAPARARPPRSVLGLLLDRDGPDAFGEILATLGDAAILDTRVLLAHRLSVDESAWPTAEDRFASDLLLADRIVDPWLRSLTAAASGASIPVVLGGHTLVGPGVRLIGQNTRR